ncbi:hypothetical protein PFNF135_03991 [Plasmodium falciparum NF135/5.C10]|uniref:Uncharacterized protein n=1 Tax=Plasmodium falciparum NF135/5.C10 TaxID=1036726 RepID=W4IFL6_PLAFA|nr:hypothetical protein PFNF135_03991 [Plasmodium falciparum NF135/5.C10]
MNYLYIHIISCIEKIKIQRYIITKKYVHAKLYTNVYGNNNKINISYKKYNKKKRANEFNKIRIYFCSASNNKTKKKIKCKNKKKIKI